MRRLCVVALSLAFGGLVFGQTASTPFTPSAYREPPPSPRFTAAKAGFSDRNVTYCSVGGVDLKFDIYYPRVPPTRPYPLVIYIHGGQLIAGNKNGVAGPNAPIKGPQYTARGFAFASLDYRLGPTFKLPTMIEDVTCAIRHLRARAASYNIDPNRIGVIGTSSGGYLAAMLGLTDPSAGFEGRGAFEGISSRVQAVVPEFPQISFERPAFSRAEQESRDQTLPPGAGADFKRRVSLPTYVSRNAPPFLFFHGGADPALSPEYSKELNDKLVAAGVDSQYVLVKNGGHGWLPNSARRAGVPYSPIPTAEQILEQEFVFFEKHLKTATRADNATPAAPSAANAQAAASAVFHSDTLDAYQAVSSTVRGAEYAVRESDDYEVTLFQQGRAIKSFTHKSVSPNIKPREDIVRQISWTQFSFRGDVEIEVRSLRGGFRAFQVLPSRLAIRVDSVASDRRRFKLASPAQIGLLINDDDKNPLFIYASAMPDPEPTADQPGVVVVTPGRHDRASVARYTMARTLVFQAGVHVLDDTLNVSAGQHVHFSTGSFVLGQIAGRAPNFAGLRIDGRGVLSGQHRGPLEYEQATMISLMGGAAFRPTPASPFQAEISGITLADLPSFAVRTRPVPGVRISGLNIGPGWHFRTDGIVTGDHSLVEDVFMNCNDDSAKPYASDTEWRRLTIWQGTNGAAIQFSWNLDQEVRNVWLHDIDVIRAETFRDAPNHALFGSMHAGRGNIHDIRIENVRVEGPVFRLFRIGTFYTHDFIDAPGKAGSIGDITFRNVTVEQRAAVQSDFLLCADAVAGATCPNTSLGPVHFENLRIAGKPIRSIDDLNPRIDPRHRSLITFQ